MKLFVFVAMCITFAGDARGEDLHPGETTYWRLGGSYKECAMDISPSLTGEQWGRFVREVGSIVAFRHPAIVDPLRRGTIELGLTQSRTPVDQRDPAWINTFVHPDLDCPLGDSINLPALFAGYGITDSLSAGMLYTYAFNANYGMLGASAKYRVLGETGVMPSVGAGLSLVTLLGVKDFDMNIAAMDLTVGKKFWFLHPFVGVRGVLSRGVETTDKVDLAPANEPLLQGTVGLLVTPFRGLRISTEYDIATVSTLSVSLSYGFGVFGQ